MKFTPRNPPREFRVGLAGDITIKDCGKILLEPDEQITLITTGGGEWDIARKEWGFYATPSINGRLARFGLRALLAGNRGGDRFLWIAERGSESQLQAYAEKEGQTIIGWLDDTQSSDSIAPIAPIPLFGPNPPLATGKIDASTAPCCPTGIENWEEVFRYDSPPKGETGFPLAAGEKYERMVLRSVVTGHFVSRHNMDVSGLYEGAYVDATYGDADGMRKAFGRIMALPVDQSDNACRVKWIEDFFKNLPRMSNKSPTVLDIGSGLAVFPAALKAIGWHCTALDPDERAALHAKTYVGVDTIHADFEKWDAVEKYDLVTLNKVLEHVVEPIGFLSRVARNLEPTGLVYLEVPDGSAAVAGGSGREEFFIEHHHIYSLGSLSITVRKAGFQIVRAERLREPSGKYTIRAMLERIS